MSFSLLVAPDGVSRKMFVVNGVFPGSSASHLIMSSPVYLHPRPCECVAASAQLLLPVGISIVVAQVSVSDQQDPLLKQTRAIPSSYMSRTSFKTVKLCVSPKALV